MISWLVWTLLTNGLELAGDSICLCIKWSWMAISIMIRFLLHVASIPPAWISLSLFLFLVLFIYYEVTFKDFKQVGIPGPLPLPFMGNLLMVIIKGVIQADRHHIAKYGKVVGTYEGHTPTLVVSDTNILKHILVKQFNHFQDRRTGSMQGFPMRKALTSLRGQQWKHVRHLLTPAFSSAKLKQMTEAIDECSSILVSNLEGEMSWGKPVDIKRFCGAYSMDVIARTAFGLRIDSQKNPNDPFVENAKKVFDFTYRPLVLMLFLVLQPVTSWLIRKLDITYERETTDFFIKATHTAMDIKSKSHPNHTDFLKLMMDAKLDSNDSDEYQLEDTRNGEQKTCQKIGLTEEEILAQSLLFFLAGYETTATTLSFACHCLAMHPEFQQKLFNEIYSTMDRKTIVDTDDVARMKYLDMFICETLRLYPPAGRITRMCSADIDIGTLHIKRGMVIVIPIDSIHRDKDLWENPEEFIPERFEHQERSKLDPVSWIPFGIGPRQCIGQRFALLEIKIALVHMILNLEFLDTTFRNGFMNKRGLLQPTNPISVTIKQRCDNGKNMTQEVEVIDSC